MPKLTVQNFSGSVLGLCNLAAASGLDDVEQALALMLTALALADRASETGIPRDKWVKMAEVIYDRARGALAGKGVQA